MKRIIPYLLYPVTIAGQLIVVLYIKYKLWRINRRIKKAIKFDLDIISEVLANSEEEKKP